MSTERATPNVKEYLRLVAWSFIEGAPDEAGWATYEGDRDALWGRMDEAERDAANALVEAIFGEWLVEGTTA